MKSKIFSAHECKNASRGQLWIPLFILVACFIAFPVVLLLNMETADWYVEVSHVSPAAAYSYIWRTQVFLAGAAVAGASGILCGTNGFWYLYSRRKVDFYHSLPRKRSELFWEKTFMGAVYYLVPCVISVFLALCAGGARGYFYLGILGVAAATVLMCFLVYLAFYFSVVFVIVFTGNLLMGVLSAAAVFFYVPVLASVIAFCQYLFLDNMGEHPYGILEGMRQYGSPLLMTIRLTKEWQQEMPLKAIPLLLLAGIALAAASFAAYVCRPSEKTGSSLVYGFTGPVIRILVVVPTALGIGWVFGSSSSDSKVVWWIFGLVLGTVMVHGLLGILFSMDARGFFDGRREFVCEALMIVLCAAMLQGDLLGYDQYMPRQEELASIGIRRGLYSADYIGQEYLSKTSDGRYRFTYDYMDAVGSYNYYSVTPELYRALENIVKNGDKGNNGLYGTYPLCYKTKSGKMIYRSYTASDEQIAALFREAAADKEAALQRAQFLEIDAQYLRGISGEFADGSLVDLFSEDAKKRAAFVEALRMDYEDASPEDFQETPCANLDIRYENLPMAETSEGLPVEGTKLREPYSNSVYVYPGFERTVALLKETGYPLSVEEVSFESAELGISRWNEEEESYEMRTAVLTDSEELNALKECLIYPMMNNGCQAISQELNVMATTKGGGEQYYLLAEDKIPQIIRDAVEAAEITDAGE